jgi:hypothetical protein
MSLLRDNKSSQDICNDYTKPGKHDFFFSPSTFIAGKYLSEGILTLTD